MADPRTLLAARLQTAVAAAFGADFAGVDAMVRRSERADYQADLAMGLAKTLKRAPRQVAEAVVAKLDLGGHLRARRDRRPRVHQSHADRRTFLEREVGALARDSRLGVPARGAPRQGGHRLLRAERREGDARRPPAHDDHRRRARPHARVPRSRGRAAEPRRRLGYAVRHADRASGRPRSRVTRAARIRDVNRAQRVLSQRAREVRQRSRVRGARAPARRAAAGRRRAHARAVAGAGRHLEAPLQRDLREARRAAARRGPPRRELLQPDAARRSRTSSSGAAWRG